MARAKKKGLLRVKVRQTPGAIWDLSEAAIISGNSIFQLGRVPQGAMPPTMKFLSQPATHPADGLLLHPVRQWTGSAIGFFWVLGKAGSGQAGCGFWSKAAFV